MKTPLSASRSTIRAIAASANSHGSLELTNLFSPGPPRLNSVTRECLLAPVYLNKPKSIPVILKTKISPPLQAERQACRRRNEQANQSWCLLMVRFAAFVNSTSFMQDYLHKCAFINISATICWIRCKECFIVTDEGRQKIIVLQHKNNEEMMALRAADSH